jgi:hypothetical protein
LPAHHRPLLSWASLEPGATHRPAASPSRETRRGRVGRASKRRLGSSTSLTCAGPRACARSSSVPAPAARALPRGVVGQLTSAFASAGVSSCRRSPCGSGSGAPCADVVMCCPPWTPTAPVAVARSVMAACAVCVLGGTDRCAPRGTHPCPTAARPLHVVSVPRSARRQPGSGTGLEACGRSAAEGRSGALHARPPPPGEQLGFHAAVASPPGLPPRRGTSPCRPMLALCPSGPALPGCSRLLVRVREGTFVCAALLVLRPAGVLAECTGAGGLAGPRLLHGAPCGRTCVAIFERSATLRGRGGWTSTARNVPGSLIRRATRAGPSRAACGLRCAVSSRLPPRRLAGVGDRVGSRVRALSGPSVVAAVRLDRRRTDVAVSRSQARRGDRGARRIPARPCGLSTTGP